MTNDTNKSAAQQWRDAAENPTALVAERDRLIEILRKVDELMTNQFGVVATHIRGLIKPVLLLLLCLCLSGCAKPIRAVEKPIPEPQPDVVDKRDVHSDEESIESPAFSISLPPNTWDWVAKHLKCARFTVDELEPISLGDGGLFTVPEGCKVKVDVDDNQAVATFSKPYPNANRGIVNADIKAVTLKPDGSGLAQTAKFGQWGFRWLDDGVAKSEGACGCGCSKVGCQCGADHLSQSAAKASANQANKATDRKPVVTAYLPDWCAACGTIKASLLRDGKPRTDLPFEVILKASKEELAADGVQSAPLVRWMAADGIHRLFFDNTNWSSLDHLVNSWRANHQEVGK